MMEISGGVITQKTAKGSKIDRHAVFLRTNGGTYILRREGGHAFADPEVESLVGKTIRCEGTLTANTFIMSGWDAEDA